MPYILDPLVAGELGWDTVYDRSIAPVKALRVQYELDYPETDDLIEATPVFLVSEELARRLDAAGMTGYRWDEADVIPSYNYTAMYGDAPHKSYRWLRPDPDATDPDAWLGDDLRLRVSDRMLKILQQADLSYCDVEPLS